MSFEDAFAVVVGLEGGYQADPADPGNWTGGAVGAGICRGTKFGISAAAYPTLDIAGLTPRAAAALYLADYWRPIAGDGLAPGVALILFDAAVNQGVRKAARILQAAAGVGEDGVVGPITLAAARERAPVVLIEEIEARRAVAYAGDTSRFWLGWFRRLARVSAAALAAAGNKEG